MISKILRLSVTLYISLNACKNIPEIPQWAIFEKEITSTRVYPDPFRDVDLIVRVQKPDGNNFEEYGFFDGDNSWRFRIMPDMEGTWKYRAVFSDSTTGVSGEFSCAKSDLTGPLEPYSENAIWPAYRGTKPVQIRSFHTGDRFFASNFSDEERKRFLDWMQNHGYNMLSVASHYLNRRQPGRGDGWNTPRLWPLNPDEYRRMESILSDLERRNIYVHPFAGFFGRAAEWPTDTTEQVLYIRYTLARIATFRNIVLNVGGPEPLLKPGEYMNGNMTSRDIGRVAALIKEYDPYNHMLSIHNKTGSEDGGYEMDPFIFEKWEDYATLQGAKTPDPDEAYNFIIDSRKVIKPVFAHEVMWSGNMYHEGLNSESLRKKAIVLIMSGAFINFGDMNGNSSSGFSGCLDPDSANTEAHEIIRSVWDIFDGLPFFRLSPRPDLVSGAFCLSDGEGKHLIYAPESHPFTINLNPPFKAKWINPADNGQAETIIENRVVTPPANGYQLLWIDDGTPD